MPDRRSSSFWQAVALRLIVVWLLGWAVVVWFQGCLAPSVRDEMREDHQKTMPPAPR